MIFDIDCNIGRHQRHCDSIFNIQTARSIEMSHYISLTMQRNGQIQVKFLQIPKPSDS